MSSTNHNYCIIMAGGIGSRFWPISREARPKQFLTFSKSGKSFLRLAYERLAKIIPAENILVVSLTRYRDQVFADIPELPEDNLLLEPYNRNTAPCLAYATYVLLSRDPEAVAVAVPADQSIDDYDLYRQTVLKGLVYAAEYGKIMTLGIVPTRPDSNFGYIQMAEEPQGGKPVRVKTFTEKPDKELAKIFIESGEFLWNAGIFICKASVLKAELEKHAPEITNLWNGWEKIMGTVEERHFVDKVYTECPRISIDYAVMEKSENVMTIPSNFGWADIGNWESFYEYLLGRDANGNAVRSQGKKLIQDNSRTIVYSTTGEKLVAVKGLEDYVVVDTDDILMICPRDEEKLKEFITELAMPDFQEYR